MELERIVVRSVIPPVLRLEWHATLLYQELDALQVTLGGGKVEGAATVVVRHRHILTGQRHASESREVSVVGSKQ